MGIEALVEALAHALVRFALVAPAVDLEQLQIRQRAAAAGAAQVAHQQVDGRIVLAEHEEELGLLFQVDQLLHGDFAARLGLGHRHRLRVLQGRGRGGQGRGPGVGAGQRHAR